MSLKCEKLEFPDPEITLGSRSLQDVAILATILKIKHKGEKAHELKKASDCRCRLSPIPGSEFSAAYNGIKAFFFPE